MTCPRSNVCNPQIISNIVVLPAPLAPINDVMECFATANPTSSTARRLPNARGTIPAIAVTAYASPVDVRQAIERGFAAHIAKPYTPATLVAAVREALDQV